MKQRSPFHLRSFLTLTLCLVVGAGCTKASKARRRLAAADRAFQAQKYDEAEIEYESVLRLSPLDAVPIRQLGLIYFEEGRPLKAFQYLKESLKRDPKNAEVELKMAELYLTSGDFTNALPLLGSVLQTNPANARAVILLAQSCPSNQISSFTARVKAQLLEGVPDDAACHCALGWIDLRIQEFSEARSEFLKASALDPKSDEPYLGLEEICLLQKDTKGQEKPLKAAAELSPLRSDIRLQYAEFKIRAGAKEEAKAMVTAITRQAPDYIPAWVFLMQLAFIDKNYDECKTFIDRILARDNYNYAALLRTGTLAMANHDVAKAISAFQRMDQIYKASPEVKYNLALAYLGNHETQKAVDSLNEALKRNPDYTPAVILLASVYNRSEKFNEAANLLSQLVKKYPNDVQAQLMLADNYLAEGEPKLALDLYAGLAKLFPKNPEIPLRMGVIYFNKLHDSAKAHDAFKASLELMPNFLPTLRQVTALDISEKHYAEALGRLDYVMKINPKDGEPLILQGNVFLNEGLTNRAESAYSKAIELNPDLADAYLSLARIYESSHQEQQALDRLEALVAKHPNDPNAWLQIGFIQQKTGHYELARDAYEKVLAVNSNAFLALNNLAYVDSEYLGQVDKALELAQRAMDLHPDYPFVADTLGWILYKKHDYARALSSIQECADKQPEDPEVQMHLGLAHYMMGDEKAARFCLERALASPTDFHDKALARAHLDILNIDPATATPETVQKLETLVQKDPQDPVPLSRLAAIEEHEGQVQKAADSLQTLLLILPQDWSAMLRLSRLYANSLDDLRKALELAKKAHTLAPDDGQASALLGELVYRTGDYSWSLSLLEEAAHRISDQPLLFYRLARAYYAVGRAAEADVAMQKAVQQGVSGPDLARAQLFLAMRAAVNDPAQAQASSARVTQILAQEPTNVPALMVSALLAERQGAHDEAAQIYQKVLSIYPLFTPATRQLAILYSRSQNPGDLDKAYELAEKARASLPDDLELAKTLGLLAYRRGEYDRSLVLLRDYTEKSGADAEAFYYLGMDYNQLKQPKLSKPALQHALDLHVSDKLASQARDTIKGMK